MSKIKPTLVISLSFIFVTSLILIITLFQTTLIVNSFESVVDKRRVILIVFDGLRHDYLEYMNSRKRNIPNLNRLADKGARVMKMIASTPTVTMPNHQTLITGVYSPYHGIVHNNFDDVAIGQRFSMENQTSTNQDNWYAGYPDPIWLTCELHSYCRSGSMLWPNTDAPIKSKRPYRFVDQYITLNDESKSIYPYDRRVNSLVEWFTQDNIDFGMIYFDQPDVTSHKMGPFHNDTLEKIELVDSYLGSLLTQLTNNKLLSYTDIILTADHGMTEIKDANIIDIDELVDPQLYTAIYLYPVGTIYPKPGKEEEVFDKFNRSHKAIKVYKRDSVPTELHYSANRNRIAPIILTIELGYSLRHKDQILPYKGNHGYNRFEDDMKATLLTYGPSFIPGARLNSTENVNVYSLIMHLLGLPANPNNGSLSSLKPLLSNKGQVFKPISNNETLNKKLIFIYVLLVLEMGFTLLLVIFILRHQ